MGKLNVILITFVLGGFAIFSGVFQAEMAGQSGDDEFSSGTAIQALSDLFLTPNVNLTQWEDCSGFTSCVEAAARIVIDVLTSILFILVDIVLVIGILLVIFIVPLPDAPIMFKMLIWAIEIGGIVILIGIFKPTGGGD